MKTDLVEKFREYDAMNPHVWDLFQRFALEAVSHGWQTLSTGFIIERIRWETMIKTVSEDGFRIANAHAAGYARKFMQHYPEHQGMFRTHASVFDGARL